MAQNCVFLPSAGPFDSLKDHRMLDIALVTLEIYEKATFVSGLSVIIYEKQLSRLQDAKIR